MSIPTGPLAFAVAICIGGVTISQHLSRVNEPRAPSRFDTASAGSLPRPAKARRDEQRPTGGTVTLRMRQGHFRTRAEMGGRSADFMVDTGASVVALTWQTGRALGLVDRGDTMDARMSTANGTVMGKFVVIPRLEIASIRVDSVAGVVLPDGALDDNLLGMSFLKRLKGWNASGDTLTLIQ